MAARTKPFKVIAHSMSGQTEVIMELTGAQAWFLHGLAQKMWKAASEGTDPILSLERTKPKGWFNWTIEDATSEACITCGQEEHTEEVGSLKHYFNNSRVSLCGVRLNDRTAKEGRGWSDHCGICAFHRSS